MKNTALNSNSHIGFWLTVRNLACATAIGLFSQTSFAQTTIVINFDDLASGSLVTNQYQPQGVIMSGATVVNSNVLEIPAASNPNIVFASTGMITADLSVADIKTVSAYVFGLNTRTGIYAYDSLGNLVGQSILPDGIAATVLSVTSSSSPITRVEIHDGGSSFFVDDFTFITAPPAAPICRVKAQDLYNSVNALGNISFKCATSQEARSKNRILKEIVEFERLRAANAGQKKLLAMLAIIKGDIKLSIKAADAAPLLLKVDELISLTKAGSCAL
ncbi:MAG: hypothetical protein IPM97_06485 [Bdellovibrionaceae bacterium]|nr:hypothetical protein [Pseudobdellovibrionaceae bacterium]